MSAPPPIISIIVVCKNPGGSLPRALASIWAQREISAELIVIDGGSTDGTHEWLETQRPRIATLVSETDRGVYDAMNKGLAAARGEWVLFLGADDRLAHEGVLSEAGFRLKNADADVVAGAAAYSDGRVYAFSARANPAARNFVHHQATFYRRGLFSEHSRFDASLAIMGDYDFNLRLRQRGVRFAPLTLRIAECGRGGLSDSGAWRGYREEIAVRHRYLPAGRCWLWDILSVVRYLRKKMVRSFARN